MEAKRTLRALGCLLFRNDLWAVGRPDGGQPEPVSKEAVQEPGLLPDRWRDAWVEAEVAEERAGAALRGADDVEVREAPPTAREDPVQRPEGSIIDEMDTSAGMLLTRLM